MEPVVPDYGGACIASVVPALLGDRRRLPPWMPDTVAEATQVVLLVLDGLGWDQLQACRPAAPTLSAMAGGRITSVAPTTTAAALTSISTGRPPAEHGIVGYRVHVGEGHVLNVLRWRTDAGDAPDPHALQRLPVFGGTAPPVVSRGEFAQTGFTEAHLGGTRLHGWRTPSALVVEVRRLVRAGEPFVYAYYDGIDKIAHQHGLGEHYEAEVAFADRLVADVRGVLPPGAVLVVTSDHGQVDVGDNVVPVAPEVEADVEFVSGESRFRWLHAKPGAAARLADNAKAAHSGVAWVRTRDEVAAEGWLGRRLPVDRLGDVVLAPFEPTGFLDPADPGELRLRSRHGSLTPDEMWVPLLAG